MNGDPNSLVLDATRVPPKLASLAKTSFLLFAIIALAVVTAGAMLFWFDPAQYRFYPFCVFHQITGLHCPGCGGTRALHQLLHGQVTAALHLNALLVVSLLLIGWQGIRITMKKFHQRAMARPVSPKWFWFFLVLAVVFGVLRNLPAFGWLAP